MLWLALIILMPVPMVLTEVVAVVPVGRVIQLSMRSLLGLHDGVGIGFELIFQAFLYGIVLVFPAWLFGRLTRDWQIKIRGSTAGLIVFSLLIGLSTFAVYSDLQSNSQPVTFLAIYH